MRAPRRKNGKRYRRDHEDNRGIRRSFGQHGGGGAGSKCGLAAHAAEGRSDVATLAALQQHDKDKKRANQDVNNGNQCNHLILKSLSGESFSQAV
jgi:hypothetical protein